MASNRWFLPRLVLLAGLLLGFAAMHTLGHAGMNHTSGMQPSQLWSTTTSTSAQHTAVMVMDDLGTASGGAIADRGPDMAQVSGRTGGAFGGAGWSVCLAVLAATVLLLLLGWLRAHQRWCGPHADAASTPAWLRRRPPPQPLALRLVNTSVLRV